MKDKCNCSMRIKLVGDGCSVCNPELLEQLKEDRLGEVRNEWREDIQMDINIMIHHVFEDQWAMVAEYFTHE